MQDAYVGDIGDYGKYGLLRQIIEADLSLSVNWYKVIPEKQGRQEDGKFTSYLSDEKEYGYFDAELFDELKKIILIEKRRQLNRIETSGLLEATFYSEPLEGNRKVWHTNALERTKNTSVVFLDPDNGLETYTMHKKGKGATDKHAKWDECRDYYTRGQNVILYQHLPRESKETCIRKMLQYQNQYMKADEVMALEFPKCSVRYYFMFIHKEQVKTFQQICDYMETNWKGLCKGIDLSTII